jgi:outer membrane protein assembly factor BamB
MLDAGGLSATMTMLFSGKYGCPRLSGQIGRGYSLVWLGWVLGLGSSWAGDWNQYRGPNGDGSSSETIRLDWSVKPPEILWKRSIGQGWSSIVGQNERLFTMEKRATAGGDREFCVAFSSGTGERLWATELDVAEYSSLVGYDDRIDGPRATPVVDGTRVVAATSRLKLFCLEVETGRVLWKRDFPEEYGSRIIAWEHAASPLLVGDLVMVNANARQHRLMALRVADGSTAWSVPSSDDQLTHATPVFARINDIPQVIFLTLSGLVSVVPESGAVLWRAPFVPSGTSTAPTPLVVGNLVHASSAYSEGRTWLTRVNRSSDAFSAEVIVTQAGNPYRVHWSSPVVHEQFVYAIPSPSASQGRLACFDLVGGTNRWTQATVGSGPIRFGSVIKAANGLLVLSEGGELVLVEPNPERYTERGRVRLLDSYCWNHPILMNGRLYTRNSSLDPSIVAVDLRPTTVSLPSLVLGAEWSGQTETVRLTVWAQNGATLTTEQLAQWEIQSTAELPTSSSAWSPAGVSFQRSEGIWVAEPPRSSSTSRYYRVRHLGASAP